MPISSQCVASASPIFEPGKFHRTGIGTQIDSVRNAAPAHGTPRKYDARVIVAYGPDPMIVESARDLYRKHADESLLITRDGEAPPSVLAGDPIRLGGRVKLSLTGHGDRRVGELGSLTASAIAGHVVKLRDVFNCWAPTEIVKVTALGCRTADNTYGPSFVQQLSDALAREGIDAPVRGYERVIGVTLRGHIAQWDENDVRVDRWV